MKTKYFTVTSIIYIRDSSNLHFHELQLNFFLNLDLIQTFFVFSKFVELLKMLPYNKF